MYYKHISTNQYQTQTLLQRPLVLFKLTKHALQHWKIVFFFFCYLKSTNKVKCNDSVNAASANRQGTQCCRAAAAVSFVFPDSARSSLVFFLLVRLIIIITIISTIVLVVVSALSLLLCSTLYSLLETQVIDNPI